MASHSKRQRTDSSAHASGGGGGPMEEEEEEQLFTFQNLAPLGEDRFRIQEGEVWVLRHGTSLQLMSICGTMLNKEFSETEPVDDYAKW